MTAAFGGLLKKAERRFVKDSPVSLLIEDEIELTEKTKTITWQLMTTADVELVDGGAILHQDGKQLEIEVLSHRSEEHTSELQSLMRISYAVFCLKTKKSNAQYNIVSPLSMKNKPHPYTIVRKHKR